MSENKITIATSLDGYSVYFSMLNVLRCQMLETAQKNGLNLSKFDFTIYCKHTYDYAEFFNKALNVTLVGKDHSLTFKDKQTSTCYALWASSDPAVQNFLIASTESWSGKTHRRITLSVYTFNDSVGRSILDKCKENPEFLDTVTEPKGSVYMLTQQGSELKLTFIGADYRPIERENYSPEILKQYDYVTSEFNKKDPDGFICVLSGNPGTGKTYLVRSMLGDIKNSKFVFIPPSYVSSIVSPNFLPTFLETAEDLGTDSQNLIFILEDADEVLAPRMTDNIHHISTLLNMTDGILGKVFNLRIIATTNQQRDSFDAAIMRPGRLCSWMKVDKLSVEQVKAVYKRLTKTDYPNDIRSPQSIATIYHYAAHFHKTGEHLKFESSGKVGF